LEWRALYFGIIAYSYFFGMILIRRKSKGKITNPDNGLAGKKSSNAPGVNEDKSRKGFLNFSQKIDYGLFLLTKLAEQKSGEPVSLKTVSEENFLSFYFMQKVALDLRRAGLIMAARGKTGGYVIARDAADIKLLEVLEALEGPVALMHCLRHGVDAKVCEREEDCRVRSGFGMLNEIIINTLSEFTLEDFINSTWRQKK